MRELVARHSVRTVLNLRGTTPWDGWYQGECGATAAAGVSQEDVTLSAHTLPFPAELRRVVEVLDRTEYPVLVHCKQGADRTGMVSAMALLLHTDATLTEARRQLWPRYGHWPVARTANIDRFFDLYEQVLAAEGVTHTPDRFRRWVQNEYCPGPARSQLNWAKAPPAEVEEGTTFTAVVRCENRSETPWELKPGHFAGVHVCYAVYGEKPPAAWEGRAGFRQERVPPGGVVEVPIPVGRLKPGAYRLVVELHDATGAGIPFRTQSFTKFGDDSLVAEFVVQ
jgi:catechol 2,3-dioxygenase-like lactoylglutathione lyase family enzyme